MQVWQNVEEAKAEIEDNPNCVLAELRRGSHGCKFGPLGWSPGAEPMIGEFVIGAWRELQLLQARKALDAYPVGA